MQQSTAHLAAEYEARVALESEAPASKLESNDADIDTTMADGSSTPAIPFVVDPTDAIVADGGPSEPNAAIANKATTHATRPPETTAFDVRFEAGKIPLDLAIFHSIRASTAGAGAGGPDRLKKMLSCILVVGGTALTPGMLGALDSRWVRLILIHE